MVGHREPGAVSLRHIGCLIGGVHNRGAFRPTTIVILNAVEDLTLFILRFFAKEDQNDNYYFWWVGYREA